jgi:transcriptional regulator GlxA family with amidase domain
MTDSTRHRSLARTRKLHFLMLPQVHLLDLAGPAQVFYEAAGFGAGYELHFCGVDSRVPTAQGLWLADLESLPEVGPADTVIVPGLDSATLGDLDHVPAAWLREAYSVGARICSICSGAFALAKAGLLHGRRCTTHWKVVDRLQRDYPEAKVVRDRLFVHHGRIVTSAGVASGIDMALSLLEEEHGPLMVAKVAREIVVYLRRNGRSDQKSIYLDFRTHVHPGVHRVQDWLVAHPEQRPTLEELAGIAGMSPRNLTRTFRQATGVTLKSFANKLKLEVAGNLLHNPDLTLEGVASRCGFQDPRQLRRLWKESYGVTPAEWRSRQAASN